MIFNYNLDLFFIDLKFPCLVNLLGYEAWLQALVFIVSLLFIGFFGLIAFQDHIIVAFMFIELILVTFIFGFLSVSIWFGGSSGFVFSYLILPVAGVESAIALALSTAYFSQEQSVSGSSLDKSK